MGLTPKTEVTLQKIAPMGDPIQIELRGYELTLRFDEARKISIEQIHKKTPILHTGQRSISMEHPRVGELGKAKNYHRHDKAKVILEGSEITLALVGNQNYGKTYRRKPACWKFSRRDS